MISSRQNHIDMLCPKCNHEVEMLKFTTSGVMCRDCHENEKDLSSRIQMKTHREYLIKVITGYIEWEWKEYIKEEHACMTGECSHDKQSDCIRTCVECYLDGIGVPTYVKQAETEAQ